MERLGHALLFVMVLSFWKPLHWLSRSFKWEDHIGVKDLPIASEAKSQNSKHASFMDLHISRSYSSEYPSYIIQTRGKVVGPEEVGALAIQARSFHDEMGQYRFCVRLFVATDVPMTLVKSVQLELRRAGVNKVMYMAWVQ